MLRRPVLFLIFYCSYYTISQTDFKVDSSKIAKNFQSILLGKATFDSVISVNQKLADVPELKDVYAYHLCKFYFASGQPDSTISYAKDALKKVDIFEKAKYYNIMGSAYSVKGEYDVAIQEMLKAKSIYEQSGNLYKAAIIENNLANVFFSLKEYASSYKYAKSSFTILKNQGDTVYFSSVASVLAVSAVKLDSLEQGEELTEVALSSALRYNNLVGQIIAYYAKGELLQKKDSINKAIEAYLQSSNISKQYRQNHYVLLNDIALLHAYSENENYDLAIERGEDALRYSLEQKNNNTLYSIHKQLGYAYAGQQKYQKAFNHLAKANDLYVEYAGVESREIINELLVEYETEKKERALAEQELKTLRSEQKLANRNWWILLLSTGIIVLLIIFLFVRRLTEQRVQRLKLVQEHQLIKAAILGEENERERIAGELHDGVASAITASKIQLELLANEKGQPLDDLIQQLSKTHADVRRISHNLMPIDLIHKSLVNTLEDYCKSVSSEKLKIHFNSNQKDTDFSEAVSKLLFRMVQELINNVQKHADASNCFVQLYDKKQNILLTVEDDGKGFLVKDENLGIGMNNMKKKLIQINGEMDVESDIGKGTLVSIRLKLI
ncbi:MAG: sensor histidine kinase [Crocinitomicaceae bacterium]|nr:sensor histidine kinase [Crocinitomicaceae bacterium]